MRTMTKYSVSFVDSYLLFLDLMKAGIETDKDMQVVCTIHSDADQKRLCNSGSEIIILGPNLSNFGEMGTQAEMVPRLHSCAPQAKILLVVRPENPISELRDAIRAGAQSAITTEASQEELLEAIRTTIHDDSYLPGGLSLKLVQGEFDQEILPLSLREVKVLSGLAFGYTNGEIAEHLLLSVRTVEANRAAIQEKLGLKSRSELVSYAMRNNLMFPESEWMREED